MSAYETLPGDDQTLLHRRTEEGTVELCLGDDTLGLLIDEELDDTQRRQVESHVDRCAACRELLASLVDLQDTNASGAPRGPLHAAPFEPGFQIDHFTVSELLGRGGMGSVYLARDAVLDRDVAIKVVAARWVHSKRARRRMLEEARATARLNHPNIVTIHAVGEIDDRPYLALEHVSGTRLRDWLDEPRVDLAEGLAIFERIAEALVAAHDAGILHRDLKPENVLIRDDGHVKVVDFGLASEIREPDGDSVQPSRTASAGTPRYMAPEQWRGSAQGKTVDVWALGVMLYELASGGRHPFGAHRDRELDIKALAERVRDGEPAASLPASTPVAKELTAIIARCLDKDPGRRPSAEDVRMALRSAARGRPSRAGWLVAAAAMAVGAALTAHGLTSGSSPAATIPATPVTTETTPHHEAEQPTSSVADEPQPPARSSATASPRAAPSQSKPPRPHPLPRLDPDQPRSNPSDPYRQW